MFARAYFLKLDANMLKSKGFHVVGYIRRSKLVPDMAEKMGTRIKRLRLERGLTQAQLGQLAGMSRGTIIEVEKGLSEHRYGTLQSILLVFGKNLNDVGENSAPTGASDQSAVGEREKEFLERWALLNPRQRLVVVNLMQELLALPAPEAPPMLPPAPRKKGPQKK